MKLYTVVIHNLQMCMKEYGCCPKFGRDKVGLFKTNTVSSVYMRITTFPTFFTRGYRSHQMLLIQN
jgi:hypothetical protein